MTGFQPTSLINCVSALIKCSADLLVSRNRQCDPDLYGCVQKPGTDLCEGWSREERSWNFRKLQLDLFQMLGHFRILMNSKCVLTFCGQRSPLAIRTFFFPQIFCVYSIWHTTFKQRAVVNLYVKYWQSQIPLFLF